MLTYAKCPMYINTTLEMLLKARLAVLLKPQCASFCTIPATTPIKSTMVVFMTRTTVYLKIGNVGFQ